MRLPLPQPPSGKVILSLCDRTGIWSQPYVDAGSGNKPLAAEIQVFLNSNRDALAGTGHQDLVDQLDAAWGWLSGNGPGAPQDTSSPVGAGADSAAGNLLKSPTVVAALVVAGVLGAAWVYRSFR